MMEIRLPYFVENADVVIRLYPLLGLGLRLCFLIFQIKRLIHMIERMFR